VNTHTTRQDVNCARIPAITRATRIPNRSPDITTDRAAARRSGGARSAARGYVVLFLL
jgi:hypothetical protein